MAFLSLSTFISSLTASNVLLLWLNLHEGLIARCMHNKDCLWGAWAEVLRFSHYTHRSFSTDEADRTWNKSSLGRWSEAARTPEICRNASHWGSSECLLRRVSPLSPKSLVLLQIGTSIISSSDVNPSIVEAETGGSKFKTSLSSIVRWHSWKPKHTLQQAKMETPPHYAFKIVVSPFLLSSSYLFFSHCLPVPLLSCLLPSLACSSFYSSLYGPEP